MNKIKLKELLNCSICSIDMMLEPITVQCGHSFCRLCINKWFTQYKQNKCPMCRQKLDKQLPNVNISLKMLIEHVKTSDEKRIYDIDTIDDYRIKIAKRDCLEHLNFFNFSCFNIFLSLSGVFILLILKLIKRIFFF